MGYNAAPKDVVEYLMHKNVHNIPCSKNLQYVFIFIKCYIYALACIDRNLDD